MNIPENCNLTCNEYIDKVNKQVQQELDEGKIEPELAFHRALVLLGVVKERHNIFLEGYAELMGPKIAEQIKDPYKEVKI